MMTIDTRHELEEKRDFKFVFLASYYCEMKKIDNGTEFVKWDLYVFLM